MDVEVSVLVGGLRSPWERCVLVEKGRLVSDVAPPRYFRESPGSGRPGPGLFSTKRQPQPAVHAELSIGVRGHAEGLVAREGSQRRPRPFPSCREAEAQVADPGLSEPQDPVEVYEHRIGGSSAAARFNLPPLPLETCHETRDGRSSTRVRGHAGKD